MTADLERSDFNPAIPKEVLVVTPRYFLFISVGGGGVKIYIDQDDI